MPIRIGSSSKSGHDDYENRIDLGGTKKLESGQLYVYLPISDSLQQLVSNLQFTIAPDSIYNDVGNNTLARWNYSSIKGKKEIIIKATILVAQLPHGIEDIALGDCKQKSRVLGIDIRAKGSAIGQWTAVHVKGIGWLEINGKGGSSNTGYVDRSDKIKKAKGTTNHYNLLRICHKCITDVQFVSKDKNKLNHFSYYNTYYSKRDMLAEGIEAFKQYELKMALDIFDYLITVNPNYYYYTYLLRATTCARLGRFDDAIKSLQYAIRTLECSECQTGQVLYAFANVYALQDNKEQAVSYLSKAIDMDKSISFSSVSQDKDFMNVLDYAPFQQLLDDLIKAGRVDTPKRSRVTLPPGAINVKKN